MIRQEPVLRVGIVEGYGEIAGAFLEPYITPESVSHRGFFRARVKGGRVVMRAEDGTVLAQGPELRWIAPPGGTFLLRDVTIGVKFHWERKEDQTFEGGLRLLTPGDGTLTAVNDVGLEAYLKSVISSEMSAESPPELLKAHAVTSRSWLAAMLDREERFRKEGRPAGHGSATGEEIVRWYDREDHRLFDVCADDHCQRYQGVTKIISAAAERAVEQTRGMFLIHGGEVCDARFYKCCGGLTENFENAWEGTPVPYLASVSDAPAPFQPVRTEGDAERWILSSPPAYCNTIDPAVIRQILPSFDQETVHFFRWTVRYGARELSEIVKDKAGMDFGLICELVPLQRGPSGRIVRLKVVGSQRTMIVGKELEIRRWLSRSHLYSSAFVVATEEGTGGGREFVLRGAGWGHGVGLCQIGAAIMATRGKTADEIVRQYFRGADVQTLYR